MPDVAIQKGAQAPAPTIASIPPADVLGRLAALQSAPIAHLKQQWRDLYGKEPPPFSRTYIQSRLAYRIQELAYGGLKPEPGRAWRRLASSWTAATSSSAASALTAGRCPGRG